MPPIWINGIWTGIGYQHEAGAIWTIKLTVDESKNEFLIEYPSLNSSGVWKLLKKDPAADRYTFQEAILNNNGNTLDGGRIIITKVNDNYMSFTYFEPPQYETVPSWSTLKRQ